MREIKVGDRFQYEYRPEFVIEVVEFNNFLIISNTLGSGFYPIGTTGSMYDLGITLSDGYKYLGNFSKSKNFSNLYDLLSEKPD